MSRAVTAAVIAGTAIGLMLGGQAIALASPGSSVRVDVVEDEAVVFSFPGFNLHADQTGGGLAVGADLFDRSARSYLKFDLSSIPSGATVTQATLYLYLNSESWAPDRDIGVYTAGDGWSETTITWNKALSDAPITGGPHATLAAPFAPPAWFALDVTVPVWAELGGDGVLTLVLRENVEAGGATWNYFAERDFSTLLAPYLDVQYETGPPSEPPAADAGADQTVEQTSLAGADVTLDGSGSTNAEAYEWHEDSTLLGSNEVIAATLPLGAHTIQLTVTSASGETDSDEVVVTVADTTPPEMTLTVLTDTLWPANHRMVLAAEVTDISDICDASPTVSITVTSNEPISGPGDGDPDWEMEQSGDVLEIWLRAWRSGGSGGRDYYIDADVTDSSGNQATASATVTVPHDRGRRPRR
jgi:hypothetical protein